MQGIPLPKEEKKKNGDQKFDVCIRYGLNKSYTDIFSPIFLDLINYY